MSRPVVIDVDTPTATDPRLNLTARVQNIQHLLDSESDITPDENIPSLLQQEETISSSGNGDDRSVMNPGDGEPTSGENTQSQGDNETGNAIQVRNVLTAFFNLSPEDQGTAVLQYKNSIDQLLEQNHKMTELVTSVNLERERMGSQIMAVMAENQRLLEVLKQQPNSEEITAKIQERCREDYDKKLTELVKLNQQEILDQKEQHQKEVAECDRYYDNLLTTSLNDIKEKYEQKLQKELKSSSEKFAEEQRTQHLTDHSARLFGPKLRRIKPIPVPRERE